MNSLIQSINTFLEPLERLLKQYKKYIGWSILVVSIFALGYLFDTHSVKSSGENALLVLWIILWLPVVSRVLGFKIAQAVMPLRKELGILMGVLALVHGFTFISPDPRYILTAGFWISGGFPSAYAFGVLASLLTLPLLLTSSNLAIRILGKKWKMLHRFAYGIIILVVVHVVLIKAFRGFDYGPVILLVLYFVGKICEWSNISLVSPKNTLSFPKGQKWLCVPCGYIYDPIIGDMDSGIKPGTAFTDIPDNWTCPICGVRKADFIPYEEETVTGVENNAIIVEKTFLNPTTLLLIIETDDVRASLPGQFISFNWKDSEGSFTRQYSIVQHDEKRYTFAIKLSENGRGGALLRTLEVGTNICVKGVYGNFVLQRGPSPKIFIATGTGIAPIYNMIQSLISSSRAENVAIQESGLPPASQGQEQKISLYFSVSTEAELFYVEQLQTIPNIDLHIHVTRESVAGFETGRVDVDDIETDANSEWYLCGNPKMITEAKEKLRARGFTKIYSEAF